jgi:hypothetical protein
MLDNASEDKVLNVHVAGGKSIDETKGVFDAGSDLDALVDKANKCDCRGPNQNGNFERHDDVSDSQAHRGAEIGARG